MTVSDLLTTICMVTMLVSFSKSCLVFIALLNKISFSTKIFLFRLEKLHFVLNDKYFVWVKSVVYESQLCFKDVWFRFCLTLTIFIICMGEWLNNIGNILTSLKKMFVRNFTKMPLSPEYKRVSWNIKLILVRLMRVFTDLQLGKSFKNNILLKYMPFRDDPPHRFSQFFLIWFCKQDWKFSFYSF